MLSFINIQNGFRKKHKLSLNEYAICDMISNLCRLSNSKVPGWCYMTRDNMGKELDLSKQTIITLIAKMQKEGFLEVNEVSKYVRDTSKWQEVYFTDGKESLPDSVKKVYQAGKESLPEDGKETLPNNYNIDNNTDNTIDKKNTASFFAEKEVVEKKSKQAEIFPKEIIFPFESENFKSQWQQWKEYRKNEHQFFYKSLQSEQAALIELSEVANGEEEKAIAIIHHTIARKWKGFFEYNKKNTHESTNPNSSSSNREQQYEQCNSIYSEIRANFARSHTGDG